MSDTERTPLPVQTEVCPVCRTVHDKPLCSDAHDLCVVCRAQLPPLSQWSGPACPSCTEKAERASLETKADPTDWEKARDVVADVVRELGGEARIGATLALNAIAQAMIGTRASEKTSAPPTDYWLCPCCQNQYLGTRLVCPISGDNRPAPDVSGERG
jgi:hypothetical protein